MFNYLICHDQVISTTKNDLLGPRVCDVCDTTFPVADNFEWVQHDTLIDIYTGTWFWDGDKPVNYISSELMPNSNEPSSPD